MAAAGRRKLQWNIIVFNCLIGNTDGHLKNISLLYSDDMKKIGLAPAYDMISTVVYPQSTRNMAFSVGGVYSIDKISENVLKNAASEVGLGEKTAMKYYRDMADKFEGALKDSALQLREQGFSGAQKLCDTILNNGIYKKL